MADGQKGLEEERRLAYVAYTRAKNLLYLTESNSFSFVIQSAKMTSRFVKEIDDQYIDHVDVATNNQKSKIFDEEAVSQRVQNKPKDVIYRNGDHIIHNIYGEGIVIGNDGMVVQIAFSHPHGVKKILATHPSIRKKTKEDYN